MIEEAVEEAGVENTEVEAGIEESGITGLDEVPVEQTVDGGEACTEEAGLETGVTVSVVGGEAGTEEAWLETGVETAVGVDSGLLFRFLICGGTIFFLLTVLCLIPGILNSHVATLNFKLKIQTELSWLASLDYIMYLAFSNSKKANLKKMAEEYRRSKSRISWLVRHLLQGFCSLLEE